MKTKRIISLFLAVLLFALSVPVRVFAADTPEFHFSLRVDGKTEKQAAPGDVITVTFTLERTDSSDAYTMYAMQNEIRYDSTFFELVEDSLFLKDGITAHEMDIRGHNRELYMNFVSLSGGVNWNAKTIVGSFQLRVIGKNGTSKIRCEDYGVSRKNGQSNYECTADEITVTVSETCHVVFEPNNGDAEEKEYVFFDAQLTQPEDPVRPGYLFTGWYTDVDCTEKWDFAQPVRYNMYLYAGWRGKNSTAEQDFPFTDVHPGDWYYESVRYVYRTGLMNGVSSTDFSPGTATSRAMIVTILWRVEKTPVSDYNIKFEDVESSTWYTEAIRWAAEKGIVTGYSDIAFGPDDPITREQLATILWRYAKTKGYDVSVGYRTDISTYGDADKVSAYAMDAMKWACGSGLIHGVGDNTLDPQGTAIRAQAATIFMRFLR